MDKNHVYIGGTDVLNTWEENIPPVNDNETVAEKKYAAVVKKTQELIKNYLQLDNVSFLFGTGSSIHLGAEGIQCIPNAVKDAVYDNEEMKELFVSTVKNMQKSRLDFIKNQNLDFEKRIINRNGKDWTYTLNGDGLICNCKVEKDAKGNEIVNSIDEIDLPLESLLDYLLATRYIREAENETTEEQKYSSLIHTIMRALFSLCDVDKGKTRESDQKRIDDKRFTEQFEADKYFFHEKFLKSLLQRPLNLKRANIFTSNYDLAFEYAFDTLGIQYIDGFSGFHHRIFKPETFDYDIFYPGSTTAGKVQRIEKVVRYFKLHGSISWVRTPRSANNIYGISELPIEFIEE